VDIATNIRLELPESIWATIQARSSIVRRGLQVEAGIIDTGYRGPLFVLTRNLFTLSPLELTTEAGFKSHEQLKDWAEEHSVLIKKGERIAQVIFHRVAPVWAKEVDVVEKTTQRGTEGFGSTGT
jgi:dUTPase